MNNFAGCALPYRSAACVYLARPGSGYQDGVSGFGDAVNPCVHAPASISARSQNQLLGARNSYFRPGG